MKKVIYILSAVALLCSSCAKHDLFDENCFTGNVGPEAYWEVGSAAMRAGSEMDFTLQYYSSVSDLDHAELWYNVMENIETSVECPWLTTFSYTKTYKGTEEKRVQQLIKSYPHQEEYWSDSLHAYVLEDRFPVSGTLAPFVWNLPVEFDSTKMSLYFGDTFMQDYKQAIGEKMAFADYRKMYIGLGLLDDFKQFTDSTEDKNQGAGVYVYHFPKDAEGHEVVPDTIRQIWDEITFEQLVRNAAENNHAVSYKRTYTISAIMRVYDVRKVYGRTVAKEIDIN